MAKKDTRPAVYRQDVHLTIRVLVDGTVPDFQVDAGTLREKIEQYVEVRLGAEVRLGLAEMYASRAPSGSRFYHPEETAERAVLNRGGLHVQIASLLR